MLVLTPADLTSSTWLALSAWLTTRLEAHRRKNDGLMPEADRNRLIGQIHEVKALLALGEPAPTL